MCDTTVAEQCQVRPSYLRCNSDSPGRVSDVINSPVSDLTSNLQVLSTANSNDCFARRRLSLNISALDSSLSSMCSSKYSSVSSLSHDHEKGKDSPSPADWLHRQHSTDDGFVDSPGSMMESPFLRMNSSFTTTYGKPCTSMLPTLDGFNSTSPGSLSVTPCGIGGGLRGGQADKENCSFSRVKYSQKDGVTVTNRHVLSDETNIYYNTFKARPVIVRQLSVPNTHHSYSYQVQSYSSTRRQSDDDLFGKVESQMDAEFLPDLRSPCSTGQFNAQFPRHLSGLFFSPLLESNDENADPCDNSHQNSAKCGLLRSPSAPGGAARQPFCHQDAKCVIRRRSSIKRLESQRDEATDKEAVETKRHRAMEISPNADASIDAAKVNKMTKRRPFMRCHSETELIIKSALQRADTHPDLIGDFTRPYCLPLVSNSKHPDLKSITADTMAKLLRNEWKDIVNSFTILDCRYPYEFEGGHIQGARNLYTQEGIINEFFTSPLVHCAKQDDVTARNILIFHCEFSSERGPNLSRFLRRKDRDANNDCYPKLFYPELYLLEGGFKLFHETHSELCAPCGYLPMLHEAYSAELKRFRSKSLSWNSDKGRLPSSTAGHRVSSLKL